MSEEIIYRGEHTCVVCPNGCVIDTRTKVGSDGRPVLVSFVGCSCLRGKAWIKQEIERPMRTIATSVPVRGGAARLASVRTAQAIPLDKIAEVTSEIKNISLDAPVEIGDVVLSRPCGTQTDVIATRRVPRADP